ncbi:MAG: 3-deoxy-7-phosphoheptulonate synthase [Chlamydiota bacterium]|nr:3-deoxy-7-phosphoheptulonate synthase [Chlamydiota bacterium]
MLYLPTPHQLAQAYPLSLKGKKRVHLWRRYLIDILEGVSSHYLLIMGPCSLHEEGVAIEYGERLADLQRRVEGSLFIIMRAFIEKSRTRGGWRGFVHQPHRQREDELIEGLIASRRLFLQLIERGIPLGAEIIDPLIAPYFVDLLTWGCIGARHATSQTHRQLASSLPYPTGFKNSLDGDITGAMYGAEVSQQRHVLLTINGEGRLIQQQSSGNRHPHLILRGSQGGERNSSIRSIEEVLYLQDKEGLRLPLIVDCAHGNGKQEGQAKPFREALLQKKEGRSVKGAMLESHLMEGKELSLTDPCLGWEESEALVREAHRALTSPRDLSIERAAIR